MFDRLAENSFASEWIIGNAEVPKEGRVDAYMRDLPAAWREMVNQLEGLGVMAVPDATRLDLTEAFRESDVTILVAHHVQLDDLTTVGIELADVVVRAAEVAAISPTSCCAVVDLLGVCRSESMIPHIKARCGAVRVIARKTRVDPVAQLRLIPRILRAWREADADYVQTVVDLRVAMLNALGVDS